LISYRVIRSRRKTISMEISPEGEVIVRAPMRCRNAFIADFVGKHLLWAERNQRRVLERLAIRASFRLKDGDSLPLWGESFEVVLCEKDALRLDFDENRIFLPDLPVQELRPRLYQLYKDQGRQLLQDRLDFWAERMGVSYRTMRIGSAVKRWGSCSRDGNINLSWLLFFAPLEAVDYLLVHELSHRVEFNHSPRFWAVVQRYIPDYPQRKKLVNDTQQILLSQGWAEK